MIPCGFSLCYCKTVGEYPSDHVTLGEMCAHYDRRNLRHVTRKRRARRGVV